jgi:hypothetical protein
MKIDPDSVQEGIATGFIWWAEEHCVLRFFSEHD